MAALWRGIVSLSRHARPPRRGPVARGNAAAGVIRPAGGPIAGLGRHSPRAQAVFPSPELDLWREPVRDQGRHGVPRAGSRRMGRGIPELRLPLESMSRSVRALHAARLARHQRSRMRRGAKRWARSLGLQLRSARQLGRQAALLSLLNPARTPSRRRCGSNEDPL